VLVQPSVYATDNSVMLSALRANPGLHRGVVVVDARVTDAELRDMHELGVRGVRFNMVSPVGNGAEMLDALAPRLRDIGWHVQWYVAPGTSLPSRRCRRAIGSSSSSTTSPA
jgi:predicted TIM-barrel fold metal-dependent hydrolase